jgi:hypothetical protein
LTERNAELRAVVRDWPFEHGTSRSLDYDSRLRLAKEAEARESPLGMTRGCGLRVKRTCRDRRRVTHWHRPFG